ncbi:long-chain-alcohol O-fatty-acyltransferase-like [Camellia sinensis]|uniref:long-chain-alcohol O-fatty-acyltransferase-like n=1 Tax=Camellia sinensis TaxID=4442 RepID=UPI001035BB5B|nr:long-chain-alcohol O-fatty-acyltransferase-like [Camellia sinensis]
MKKMKMMMDGEIKSFIKVWIASIASICYCYFIAKHIPRGITRLLFLIPILSLFILLPFNLHSLHLGGPTTFYLVWLANFKLLLFSFDMGPLPDSKSLLNFISNALLPIQIKHDPFPKSPPNPKTNPNPPPHLSSNRARKVQRSALLAIKVLLLAMVIRLYDYRQHLHPNVILVLYCCHVYLAAELILAMSAFLARAILGLELEPQFNEPYLATSLQDFWGRRWNLMVTSILRPTVYVPIRSISTRILGRRWATLPAIWATFLVSGLMHEIIYFYFTRVSPTWEVTWFFVLHGVCTAAEVTAKKAVGGRWRLHRVISGPLTVGFVMLTAFWLFFPQIIRNGVDQRAIGEYSILVDFFRTRVQDFKVILF